MGKGCKGDTLNPNSHRLTVAPLIADITKLKMDFSLCLASYALLLIFQYDPSVNGNSAVGIGYERINIHLFYFRVLLDHP